MAKINKHNTNKIPNFGIFGLMQSVIYGLAADQPGVIFGVFGAIFQGQRLNGHNNDKAAGIWYLEVGCNGQHLPVPTPCIS